MKNNLLKNKKCLVTGGAGFIGSHLSNTLIELGAEVIVLDDLRVGSKSRVPDNAKLHEFDINNSECGACFEGVDVVFHMAAIPGVPTSIEDPEGTHLVNVDGTHRVLEYARKAGVKRVVFSSSAAVYGSQEVDSLDEDLPLRPESPYAYHKIAGEFMMKTWAATYGLETVSLRYFNVYGNHMDPDGPYAAVVGKFLNWRKAGESLCITGDGEQTRDFVHVSDVVNANVLAATSGQVGRGEACNVGTGLGSSVNKIAECIGGEKKYIDARQEVKNAVANIARAQKLLSYSPSVEINSGISELVK